MTDIKKGDRVKVTTETEYIVRYASVYREGYDLEALDGSPAKSIEVGHGGVVKVEKVEPPVEVFKPGDVVRNKSKADPDLRVITRDGWVNLTTGAHYPVGRAETRFTSECYERVTVE